MKINKDNMIITIDTELCANGEKIAKELADMLHLPCYGEEILDKASEIRNYLNEQIETKRAR